MIGGMTSSLPCDIANANVDCRPRVRCRGANVFTLGKGVAMRGLSVLFSSVVLCGASFLMIGSSVLAADPPKRLAPTAAEVSYGPHERNVLDFWKAAGDGPRPLLVHIHGGGWIGGNKTLDPAKYQAFLDKGISLASINYRLTDRKSVV